MEYEKIKMEIKKECDSLIAQYEQRLIEKKDLEFYIHKNMELARFSLSQANDLSNVLHRK